MDFFDVLKLVWRIGLLNIARYFARLAWIVVPFCTWFLIIKTLGKAAIPSQFLIVGTVIVLLIATLLSAEGYLADMYDYTVMKRIENARQMFANPDVVIARQYEEECNRILQSYLYTIPLVEVGLRSLVPVRLHGRQGWLAKLSFGLGLVVSVCLSYSVAALLDRNRILLFQILDTAGSLVGITELLQFVLAWGTRYWMPALAVIVLSSLCYATFISRGFPTDTKLAVYWDSMISISRSTTCLLSLIADFPPFVKDLRCAAKYKPFVDPQTVPAIIQRAVQNVEGGTCNVTFYSNKLNTTEECENLVKLFVADRRMPRLLRYAVFVTRLRGNAGAVILETANAVSPALYLGTIENRCLFVGLVRKSPAQRVRIASFHFDNAYVRTEFVNIMKIERQKCRQLLEKLPPSIEAFVKTMET